VEMDQTRLIADFKSDLKTRGLSADTIKSYPLYAKRLYDFSGDLLAVDERVLTKYLSYLRDEKKIGFSSTRRYFAALGTFYDFLVFMKYLEVNPITSVFKKRYLRSYKSHDPMQRRQCISVEQAKLLVESILNPRERAVVVTLLKTGIRRKELSELDLVDLDMKNWIIHIKPTGKRSNEIVFFDEETAKVLGKWLVRREKLNKKGIPALFLDSFGNRLSPNSLNIMFAKYAAAAGLHDPESRRLEDRLSPHCCRHFFTTRLLEAGCQREYVMELRGDSPAAAVDVYFHPDPKKLRQAYLDCVPQLGL
jgi:integrase/recombinase XerD